MFKSCNAGAAVAGILALGLSGAASGQGLTRTIKIVPVPTNVNAVADARVSIDPGSAKIGETVKICFHVSAPGFVTLWDIGTDHSVSRIFPNALSGSSGAAEQVGDTNEHCAGKDGDAFRFQVDGPAGIEDIYILWTSVPDLQPKAASFDNAEAFAAALKSLDGAPQNQWVAKKASFDVVEATPPARAQQPQAAPAPTPAPTVSELGKHMYLFAAGSNVKDLTKSNQDARMIRDKLQATFGIPDSHLKVAEDVTKQQFRDGVGWLAQATQPNDIAIVYYSGHGMQAPDRTGTSPDGIEEAFIPIEFNSQPVYYQNLILNHDLVHWTNAIPAQRVIILADSCHSGGMVRGIQLVPLGTKPKFYVPTPDLIRQAQEAATKDASDPKAVAAHREKPKAMLFAAARRDQTAAELKNGSLFTLALAEVLDDASKQADKEAINMADVFEATRQVVEKASESRQSPMADGRTEIARSIQLPPTAPREAAAP